MREKKEIWKMVKNYESLYMISNLGRIKSLYRYVPQKPGQYREHKEKILQPSVDNCRLFAC